MSRITLDHDSYIIVMRVPYFANMKRAIAGAPTGAPVFGAR